MTLALLCLLIKYSQDKQYYSVKIWKTLKALGKKDGNFYLQACIGWFLTLATKS
jgi:hypothetical protein